MPGKSKLSSYCIVRDDEKLHTILLIKMKEHGWSFHKAAEYLDTDPSNVRKFIMKGDHSISQQKVIALASAFNISVGLELKIISDV